jgi:hypothetical protein
MSLLALASLASLLGIDAAAATSLAESSAPPQELTCLAQHYNLTPALEKGVWVAVLPGGVRVPFDDGKVKTFDQRLEAPDLKDMFLIPYHPGPIREVTTENDDPGRIRVEAIFATTYGDSHAAAAAQIRVHFMGMPIRVHRKIAPALERVAKRIVRAEKIDAGIDRFLRRLSGGFAARNIAGTDRLSAHAFGIAVDLDKSMADYWRWQKPLRWRNRIPQAIVDAFEAEGFIWGGRWYHYDTMHFEYRPELFSPLCQKTSAASGIRSR